MRITVLVGAASTSAARNHEKDHATHDNAPVAGHDEARRLEDTEATDLDQADILESDSNCRCVSRLVSASQTNDGVVPSRRAQDGDGVTVRQCDARRRRVLVWGPFRWIDGRRLPAMTRRQKERHQRWNKSACGCASRLHGRGEGHLQWLRYRLCGAT